MKQKKKRTPFAGKYLTETEKVVISACLKHHTDKEAAAAIKKKYSTFNNIKRLVYNRFGIERKGDLVNFAIFYGFDHKGNFSAAKAKRTFNKKWRK